MCVARRLGICLFKDTHDLRLKFRKFQREHDAPRVQDEIESLG
jgi:hypothetical protein